MFPLVAVLSPLSGQVLTWMSGVLLTLLPTLSGSPFMGWDLLVLCYYLSRQI